MNVALHDADKTAAPNLALMKLSAWHKSQGDNVDWFDPLHIADLTYSSKVFTYTPSDPLLPDNTVKGGSGYGIDMVLSNEVEHIIPDYSLYNIDYSLGFLTRGCSRKCKWCIVPKKEGSIRAHADIEEFTRHKDVVLMDNNVLAHDHGIAQIEKIARLGLRVDFNQGLDARLIDDDIARLLSKVKWLKPLRLACDSVKQMSALQKAVTLLRWHNATPRRYFCYVLIEDIDDAIERLKFLKGLDLDPFAQPFIDEKGTPATFLQRSLARWVNTKILFKTLTWDQYRAERGPNRI